MPDRAAAGRRGRPHHDSPFNFQVADVPVMTRYLVAERAARVAIMRSATLASVTAVRRGTRHCASSRQPRARRARRTAAKRAGPSEGGDPEPGGSSSRAAGFSTARAAA